MTLSLLAQQILCIFFLAVIIYCSFRSLNLCTAATSAIVRVSYIVACTAGVAIMIQVIMGVIPHWTYTAFIASVALKMISERRRDKLPRMVPAHANK